MYKYQLLNKIFWKGEELPEGMGRVKPDLITFGTDILGANLEMRPEIRSGTSIAAPIVTASVA